MRGGWLLYCREWRGRLMRGGIEERLSEIGRY